MMTENKTTAQWKAYFLTPEGQANTLAFGQTTTTLDEAEAYQKTPEGKGRFAAMLQLYEQRVRPDAADRADELRKTPVNQVPPDALQYAQKRESHYGEGAEVLRAAFKQYARYVEGFPCTSKYGPEMPDEDAKNFFANRGILHSTHS